MRRVILAVSSTVVVLVLLLGFKSQSAPSVTKPASASAGSSGSSGTGSGTGSGAGSGTGSGTGSSTGTKTVTGEAADTRYGPVQVKVTVTSGKVTQVDAIDYPQTERRDQEINSYAIPQLNQEALAAGNANIDIISGATYTSDGYIQSLQSALDKL
jgi:major membrane immunogen (membrane-anchored lipoprotein)